MKTTADQHKISQMNQIRSRDPILRLCLPLLCLKKIIKIIYIYMWRAFNSVINYTSRTPRRWVWGWGGWKGGDKREETNEWSRRERERGRERERERQTDRDIYKIREKMKLNGTEWYRVVETREAAVLEACKLTYTFRPCPVLKQQYPKKTEKSVTALN